MYVSILLTRCLVSVYEMCQDMFNYPDFLILEKIAFPRNCPQKVWKGYKFLVKPYKAKDTVVFVAKIGDAWLELGTMNKSQI